MSLDVSLGLQSPGLSDGATGEGNSNGPDDSSSVSVKDEDDEDNEDDDDDAGGDPEKLKAFNVRKQTFNKALTACDEYISF